MKSQTLTEDEARMKQIVDGLQTNASRIRALSREGFEKSAIARFLGVRYQQVYNVLKRSKLDAPATAKDGRQRWDWVKVGPAGRVMIPMAYIEALGLREGDDLQLELAEDELRIVPKEVAITRVQDLVRQYVPDGVSLVDQLIAERRREAAAEEEDA